MIIVCTASADTYVTDKIIDGNFRAADANVGQASTLDLFKLYNETTLNGSSSQNELSRALVKFDLGPVTSLTSSILNINSSNFRATLEMKDIMTGHAVPRNFTLSVFPLSQSFDEGEGIDTGKFDDVHVANFLTASYTAQNNVWFASGANAGGLLGAANIDYIASGNLMDSKGVVSFEKKQVFSKGTEDLSIDITSLVSASVAGQIPDLGFRLSFTGSQESDSKTRFVKRFASRHVDRSNLVSGSSLTSITGSNSLFLHVKKGLFSYYASGSQHTAGSSGAGITGLYSASFALSSVESGLYNKRDSISKLLREKGEVEFTTYWESTDKSIAYHTGSLVMKKPDRRSGQFGSREPQIIITNAEKSYSTCDTIKFKLFGNDLVANNNLPVKTPYSLPSVIYEKVYYQVVDRVTGKIVIPYDRTNNGTKVSSDSEGMFFDFKMQALVSGRSYAFDFYIVDRGDSYLVQNRDSIFGVKA